MGEGHVKFGPGEGNYLQSVEFKGNEARFVFQEDGYNTVVDLSLTVSNGVLSVTSPANGLSGQGNCSENKCTYTVKNQELNFTENFEFYDDKLIIYGKSTEGHHSAEWRAELAYVQETGTTWSDTLLPAPRPLPPENHDPAPMFNRN